MTPRYATPENVAQITRTPPEGLLGGNKNDEDDENSEEEYYEDEYEDEYEDDEEDDEN